MIDREKAAKINPLISEFSREDTLSHVSELIVELGYMVAITNSSDNIDVPLGCFYHVTNCIAAAVDYEAGTH